MVVAWPQSGCCKRGTTQVKGGFVAGMKISSGYQSLVSQPDTLEGFPGHLEELCDMFHDSLQNSCFNGTGYCPRERLVEWRLFPQAHP